jgi:hypothetical protein
VGFRQIFALGNGHIGTKRQRCADIISGFRTAAKLKLKSLNQGPLGIQRPPYRGYSSIDQ